MYNADDIKNICKSDQGLIRMLLPQAKKRGDEWLCGNVYGERGESFAYNEKKGAWKDFATGESGSSIVDLVMTQRSCDFKEALKYLQNFIGDIEDKPVVQTKNYKKDVDDVIELCPEDRFPDFVYMDNKSHRVSRMWPYKNIKGQVIAYDCRVDYPDGHKDVIPMRWSREKNKYYMGMLPYPRSLCGIEDLENSKKVIIVEGCKTREAAKKYFPNFCVLTWQGGCKAVNKADWSVVKDKDIIIIPDADAQKDSKGKLIDWEEQCGYKAALDIAKFLCGNNRIRIVNTKIMSELKSGWDIADALEAGTPQKDIVEFVKENLYEYVSKKEKEESDNDTNVVIEKKESSQSFDYDDSYFRCLGERGSSTYFFKYASGQVIEFSPAKYDNKHLVSLAPLVYWESYFGGEKGIDWLQACDFFCRVQERVGYFNAMNVRGRGCWFDEDHIVLHLGQSLIVDGNPTSLRAFKTNNIYEHRDPIHINIENPMNAQNAKKLIDVCSMARWEENYFGEILAGWIFSAMVCGAMKFRSHLYLIGQSGSGKSWLQDHIIKPIMGKMSMHASSKTTEAGIRAMLNNDILPVICDENEVENSKKDGETLQAIFDLARNASSEYSEPIIKSSPSGQIKVYYCRSAFLFSSIKTSMDKVADLNRTAFIRLKGKPVDCSEAEKLADSMKFNDLKNAVEGLIDSKYCESLIARAVKLAGVMRQSQQIVSDVSAKIFGDRRQGDQLGMIIAGLQGLKSDYPITELEAEEYLRVFTKNKERIVSVEEDKQEIACLDTLMKMPVKIQNHSYPLQRCLASVLNYDEIKEENNTEIETILAYGGIKTDGNYLYLSTKPSSDHCTYFASQTMYGVKGWIDEICRCSKDCSFETVKFTSVSKARSLRIPIRDVFKMDKTEGLEMPI